MMGHRISNSLRAAVVVVGFLLHSASQAATNAAVELRNDREGKNWLGYGRTYNEQHSSPLKQIHSGNIDKLGLAWSLDIPNAHNGQTVPLAVDGVIYFTIDLSWIHAVDARTGKLLWRFDPETYKVAGKKMRLSWGPRGIAYWNGKIFAPTLDGRLIALDAKTGKQVWSVMTVPADDSSNITGAPRVFNGKVVIGHGGGDFGNIRGYITAYDTETGKQLWRFHSVPGNPADGFENKGMELAAKTWTGEWWKFGGGGAMWNGMAYDADFNRFYVATGNGRPDDWKVRSPGGGDNLFLGSIVALDADTGDYVWHLQENPANTWDFDVNMDITLATLKIDGKQRKVLMHAPKNGFMYVLDRADGKLISAEKFEYVTWASHIDLEARKPVENPLAREGKIEIWPSATGAHSIMTQAFNPQTQLLYIPVIRSGNGGRGRPVEDVPGRNTSRISAWDPVLKKEVWQAPTPATWNGGIMTTEGNLVFQGQEDGKFKAYDAKTGKEVWAFDAKFGITGAPITFEADGKQYVSVVAGWGGTGAAAMGQATYQFGWSSRVHTHRLLTFALNGKTQLPYTPPPTIAQPIDDPNLQIDPQRVQAGSRVSSRSSCGGCHGFTLVAGGYAPDLRASPITLSADAFRQVLRGSLLPRGMPQYDELSDDEIESLRHFIRDRARNAVKASATGAAR